MKPFRFLLALVSCAIMATCQYNRDADGRQSVSGGVTYELPTKGYAK